jgi:hypothetical protein
VLKEALPKLTKIRDLDLSECSWAGNSIAQLVIRYLRKLQRLNLSRTSIGDSGISGLPTDRDGTETGKSTLPTGKSCRQYRLSELEGRKFVQTECLITRLLSIHPQIITFRFTFAFFGFWGRTRCARPESLFLYQRPIVELSL